MSGVGIFNSGSPLFINQDGDTLNVDSEEIRPNLVAGQYPTLPRIERIISRWFNTAAFARATTPMAPRPAIRWSALAGKVLDISPWQSVPREGGPAASVPRRGLQRVQLGELGNPNGTLGNTNFGIISSAGAAREMQLSLQYLF